MSRKWVGGLACLSMLAVLVTAVPVLAQKGKTTFEVYQDTKKEWRWRYKAANGTIIAAPGEGYKAKADATKAIESLQEHVAEMKPEFYEDGKKEHRWRLKAKNGQILAVASEGYKEKAGAEKGFDLLKGGAKSAKIVEVETKKE